jgi:hypothetical protein
MGRVIAGFLIAPLAFGLLGGSIAIVVVPFMYIFALVIALPLFFLFKRLRWLGLWHAALVGFVTAALCVALDWHVANPYHTEIYGPTETLAILAIGIGTGVLFWAIAIYRNDALPQLQTHWLATAFVGLALVTGGYFFHEHLETTDAFGVVENLPTHDAYITDLTVRLESGELISARVMRDTSVHLARNRAVYLQKRNASFSFQKMFWVMGCRDNAFCL